MPLLTKSSKIKEFYDQIQFPGHYSAQKLELQSKSLTNPYLKIIDRYITNGLRVLDVGCGTGLISNLLALRYPASSFTGVDFADSINYAKHFACTNNIPNINFVQQDFLRFQTDQTFDRVICQGVLHHIPDFSDAVSSLEFLVRPGGLLILGVYHPWGKIAKKCFRIDYKNNILYQDQELNPHETSFTIKQVKQLFPGWNLIEAYPRLLNIFVSVPSLFNYRNGGLITYILEKPYESY